LLGLRLGGGTVLNNAYHHLYDVDNYYRERLRYRYAYYTMHLATGRYLAYFRMNVATKSSNMSIGLNYRLK
jgi:hypothetical protein